MVLKKQTIWLLTMLTLMVVLSAYYLFTDQPQEISIHQNDSGNELTDGNNTNEPGLSSNDMGVDMNFVQSTTTEDLFSSIRLERQQIRAQMMDQYYNTVQNSSDKNAIAEASAKMDEIETMETNENTVETLIKAKGFPDAVIIMDKGIVEVTVQADQLNQEQAVSIIDLVSTHMNVPGINVKVNYVQ